MSERPVKAHPTLGCCGLDCGLCPRYYADGSSRCPGCCGPGFFEKRPACGYITCCVKKKGLEVCAQCDEFPCVRFERWIDKCWEHDSFVTHARVKDNMTFIRERGLEAFLEQQGRRSRLLQTMLGGFNDGRSRSFYCIATALLTIPDLETALAKNESPHSKLWGICDASSRIFVARTCFVAPGDAACHPTPRFIPAASCGDESLDFGEKDVHTAGIASDDMKARARILRGHLQDSAMRGGIELRLWRKGAK